MPKKFDLHVHSHFSPDSLNTPQDLVKKYCSLGFAGFSITDHGKMGAHKKAREYAKEKNIEMEIIGGCEFLTDKGELLGLFIEEMPSSRDFGQVCDFIHDQGGVAILPHPFDFTRGHACNPQNLGDGLLKLIDGLETFNAHCLTPTPNRQAQEFASARNLVRTGGSDAHFIFECGSGYTQIEDNLELDIAIRKSKTSPGGKLLPFFVHGPPRFVKLAKKFGVIRKHE
jgi:predicted metal-dependent phosphoesterase TrpH